MDAISLRVLLIGDDPEYAGKIGPMLDEADPTSFVVQQATGLDAAWCALQESGIDAVLLDSGLSEPGALDDLRTLREREPDVPVVMLVDGDGEDLARESLEEGAQDWISRETLTGSSLARSLRDAVQSQKGEARARLFRFAVDTAADALLVSGPDGRFSYVNEASCALLGYTRDELLSMSVVDLHRGPSTSWTDLWEGIKGVGGVKLTSLQRTKDGSLVPVEVSLSYLKFGPEEYALASVRDTSASMLAQDAVRASEERFFKAFALSPSPMFIATYPDGRMVEVNESFMSFSPYTRDEVIGKTTAELGLVGPEAREEFLRQIAEEGRVRSLAMEVGGDWGGRVFLVSAELMELDGEPHVLGVTVDVTEREEAIHALEESEVRFRLLSDSAFEGISFIEGGRFVDANQTLARMLGCEVADLIGRRVIDFVAPESRELVKERIQAGYEEPYEHDAVRADGTRFRVQVQGRAMTHRGRRVRVTSVRDITWREEAAKAVQESEMELRDLVERAPYGIGRTTVEGRFLSANPAFVKMLGYDSEEDLLDLDIGRDLHVNPESRARIVEQLVDTDQYEYETRLRCKDGAGITVRIRGRPVRDAEGEVESFEFFVEDITERQALESQLRQSQKLETLGTLASGIAHDFNNLLVPILGYADLARSGVSPEHPRRRELEDHLFDAADRAGELVEQILTFGRDEESKRRVMRPDGPVRNALRLIEAMLPAPVRLRRRIVEPVGRIRADRAQLQQVVMNLCTNAAYAMREEGGVLEVSLETVPLEEDVKRRHPGLEGREAVLLTVRDTGVGMSPEVQDRIFDPFFTTKEDGQGTGLGLSVVYGIIAGHEGVIEVSSSEGEGSVVEVYLPVAAEEGEGETPGAGDVPRGTEHVLFVDDDEATLATVQRLLENLGYQVTLCSEGSDAIERFQEDPSSFDVVLTDYDLPGMSGTRLALEMMEIRPDIPVLLVTGTHLGRVREAEHLGLRGHVRKPFTAADLSATIREVTDG